MLRQVKQKVILRSKDPYSMKEYPIYLGPKSPYIEILENWACTVNLKKTDTLLFAAAQSAHGEQN